MLPKTFSKCLSADREGDTGSEQSDIGGPRFFRSQCAFAKVITRTERLVFKLRRSNFNISDLDLTLLQDPKLLTGLALFHLNFVRTEKVWCHGGSKSLDVIFG
jgi:hypothetical protein